MSRFLFWLFYLAVLHRGTSLECYSCRNCPKNVSLWRNEPCGTGASHLPANYEYACITSRFTDPISHKPVDKRQCVMIELKDGKPEYTCPTVNGHPVQCSVCMTDLCNSGPPNRPNGFVAFAFCITLILYLWK